VKAGDVDWERKSLLVRSPKTAGNPNHADRVVPVCQELQPIILDLYEAAPEGAVEMVPQAHRAHVNIFLGLKKIVERAGLKPWPRLLQNLRSSCATDWAYDCPGVESSKWMGHSKVVAAEHYLQSPDLNFKAVTGSGPWMGRSAETSASPESTVVGADSGTASVQTAGQHGAAPVCTPANEKSSNPSTPPTQGRGCACPCETGQPRSDRGANQGNGRWGTRTLDLTGVIRAL
jgi:hypothetical protein